MMLVQRGFVSILVLRGALAIALASATAIPIESRAQQGEVITPRAPTAAQAAASAVTSRKVSNADLADAIRRAGLTHEALRSRLQAAGYDPQLADPFFAVSESIREQSSASQVGDVATTFAATAPGTTLEAFQLLGLIEADKAASGTTAPVEANAARPAVPVASAIFGKDVFDNASTAFLPVVTGPVDPSYRIGTGDQLQLILTGDTEKSYQTEIRRDGTILVPELGQIDVAGLTLDAARAVIRRRAAAAYSGINTGSTRLDVSVQRIRTNAVFVIGEVENPGAQVVSGLSTSFYALARAGGPNGRGSFRDIQVRRAGRVIQRLDIYKYLVDGDASSDLRTEHGDVIYVPLASRNIRVAGAVRRPGTFELLPDEGFGALIRFVGGVLPTAALDRVQIDRVLPPEQRAPGVERAIIDVHTDGSLESLAGTPLSDGDMITVFAIGETRRNAVTLHGEVVRPGTYEFEPGLTIQALLGRAQGTLPWALTDRVKVLRVIPESGKRLEVSLDLRDSTSLKFALREFDQMVVLDGRLPGGSITVAGAVWRPSQQSHAENQTLLDVLDAAGGLKPEASAIVLSRKRIGRSYSDTTSHLIRVDVDQQRAWRLRAAEIEMAYDDNVYVLSSPGVREQRFVAVSGLFAFPGAYAINEGVDRIADVVRRAGAPLPSAFALNFHVKRNGLPMPVDLERARTGDRNHNMLLLAGDELYVGPNPSTVMVMGEVGRTVLVLHHDGWNLRDYVEAAGGPTANADLSRATVEEISGRVGRSRPVLFFFHTDPRITPGAKITVPAVPEHENAVQQAVTSTLQYASMLASLAIAYAALTR